MIRPACGGKQRSALPCRSFPAGPEQPEQQAADHHDQAEALAHRHQPEQKTDLRIGLPELLDHHPQHPIGNQKQGENAAVRPSSPLLPGPALHRPQQRKQDQPLEQGLVELGGVARHRAAVGEDHAPGDVGRPAEQFTVDEIADPAQAQTDGDRGDIDIGALPEIDPIAAAEQPAADDQQQTGAVERHPPLPGGEDLQGVAEVVARIVEQDVAQAAAEDHRQDQDQVEVFEMLFQLRVVAAADLSADEEVAGGEADDVHQAVPADLQRAEGEENRVESVDEGCRHDE